MFQMFQFLQYWRRPGKSHPTERARRSGGKPKRGRSWQVRLRLEQLEERSLLATIMVTSLVDNLTADGGVTLREAIQAANTNLSVDGSAAGEAAPAGDTIVFQPGLIGPINLLLGQFQITETLTIQGLGAGQTTVDGGNASRLFDSTNPAGDVTFDGQATETCFCIRLPKI